MWEFIDRAVCLTVENSDRIEDFVEDSKRVGLDVEIIYNSRVLRSRVCHPLQMMIVNNASCCGDTCKSLTQNHLTLIRESYEAGDKRMLIFEDDARWVKPLDMDKLRRVLGWVKENNPDIFFFGYLSYPNFFGTAINKDILRLSNPLLAHAYILNRNAMSSILEDYDKIINEKISIDSYYAHFTPELNKYGSFPSLSYQCAEPYHFKETKRNLGLDFVPFNALMDVSNRFTYYSEYISPAIFAIIVLAFLILLVIRLLVDKGDDHKP